MLAPLEPANRNHGSTSKRNSKISSSIWPWCLHRRPFMCRLPFLFIWTFIALIFLYKSLNNSNPDSVRPEKAEQILQISAKEHAQVDGGGISLRRETRVSSRDDYTQFVAEYDNSESSEGTETSPLTHDKPTLPSVPHRTSTAKKTITEYNRRGKVCILLIQSASVPVFNHKRKNGRTLVSSHTIASHGSSKDDISERSLKIPNHIRLVIEILGAHKIEYSIASTRFGIPTSLLTDTNESSQFSVIVVDDFLRYTKLDRWMRDQLDRYCRKNQIGIVTYLNPDELNRKDVTNKSGLPTGKPVGSTTQESITDQFPLTLKPIDRRVCKKQSTCTYDYKLNDQASILRILKRRRDFVVAASLRSGLDSSMPWISMSSDHITYEPLTWARIKSRSSAVGGNRFMPRTRRSTQNSTLTMSSPDQNNVRPFMMIDNPDTKLKQTDYGTYESPAGIDEADDGLHAVRGETNIGVTQEYSKNQLLAATSEPNLRKSTVLDVDSYNNGKTANHVNSTMMHDGSERHPYSDDSSSSSSSSSNDNNNTTTRNYIAEDSGTIEPELEVLSMFDRGLYDGIKRVIFGRANHHWLDRIILLDSIEHLSSGKILTPLERYIQIDIDDIFVGERGKRMNLSDVDALIEAQESFSKLIDDGFKFNLGFSGKYYKHGDEIENAGDEYLLSKANHFNWFCHTWSHSKAHLMNDTSAIEAEIRKNLHFAIQHQLPLIGHGGRPLRDDTVPLPETYAIAPHHSGVYPVHEQLYEIWRKVLNVRVTSTEEYPGLRPASNRKAFVHQTIKVLPRQTCGLYTHTIYRDRYPGGVEKLEASIRGGELFETILHNPVNIYMTHMSNYAHDRLALSTFSSLIEFVQSYTNLQLKFAPSSGDGQLGPNKLANYYFDLFPQEQQPIWTNPCKDRRHLAIWAPAKHKYCTNVPQLLIVGPQKTGTTALYSFLNLHPEFRTSHQSPVDFEEVQFFNDKHYSKGVDWYFSRFSPLASQRPGGVGELELTELGDDGEQQQQQQQQQQFYYFDKSATYFDDPKVARRAESLLPEARIIILLVDPADRAYSWYQHIKAHGDGVANSMSFEQIIMFKEAGDEYDDSSNNNNSNNNTLLSFETQEATASRVRALRNRCLQPGYYSVHLSRWLEHFPSRQIVIIDGQWFRQNPASVMNKLQLILRTEQRLDYENLLVFDERKGFYCHRSSSNGGTLTTTNGNSKNNRKEIKCLGPSKGRKYPPMAEETRLYLNRHYLAYNKQLARLLSDIGQPLPIWLEEAISAGRRGRRIVSMVFS